MPRLLVLYGTQEGHTAKIAAFVAGVAGESGYDADVWLCKELPPDLVLVGYDAIILAAPVHNRRHEGSVVEFVRQHRVNLESLPSAFISIGLVPLLPRFLRRSAAAGVGATLIKETGWKPVQIFMAGGAVMYRSYTPQQRIIFKLFMALLGGPTNTSRDHELTDWASLQQFIRGFLAGITGPLATRGQRIDAG